MNTIFKYLLVFLAIITFISSPIISNDKISWVKFLMRMENQFWAF